MHLSEKEYKTLCNQTGISYIPPPKKKRDKKSIIEGEIKFDSMGEKNFYLYFILPRINMGQIIKCETHRSFIIIDANGEKKLSEKRFTPDFILYWNNGKTTVVEMKGSVVKKLQRDYQLRKHLFIERYCISNSWEYQEEKSEDWT